MSCLTICISQCCEAFLAGTRDILKFGNTSHSLRCGYGWVPTDTESISLYNTSYRAQQELNSGPSYLSHFSVLYRWKWAPFMLFSSYPSSSFFLWLQQGPLLPGSVLYCVPEVWSPSLRIITQSFLVEPLMHFTSDDFRFHYSFSCIEFLG